MGEIILDKNEELIYFFNKYFTIHKTKWVITNSFKSEESPESTTVLLKASSPPSLILSVIKESWLMEKTSKDKSSQSPDSNSPDKSSKLEEEPELEPLEELFQRNKLPKSSHKPVWENTTPAKPEEKTSMISKDSKSSSSEEDSQSYSEPSQKANDDLLI
jgi:hypothetical protein